MESGKGVEQTNVGTMDSQGDIRVTYCRLCEAFCGLLAEVQDGHVVHISADPDNVGSRGFICPKGTAAHQITHDPDRILHPMKKVRGTWQEIPWQVAIAEIAGKLNEIRATHGPHAIGVFNGNPHAYSYASRLFTVGWADAVGTRNVFGSGSQDNLACFVASKMLYGAALERSVPDVDRSGHLLILGSNPVVSQGTLMNLSNARERLRAVSDRGGRVVVIDPRRSETAQIADEHHFIRPGTDALLLLALLRTIFDDGLADALFLREHADGVEDLRVAVHKISVDVVADRTGIEGSVLRRLARDFAVAESACAYGRPVVNGFGTLAAFLIEALNVVTGNLDIPGGAVFSEGLVDMVKLVASAGEARLAQQRSRIGSHARVLGQFPAGILVDEIETPGAGQIRALMVVAGNPVLSIANGRALSNAMAQLECAVAVDLYLSETATHCNYFLPATTFLEREDFPLFHSNMMTSPYAQWTEPVIAPQGEAWPEWRIFSALSDSMGLPFLNNRMLHRMRRLLRVFGTELTPRAVFDALVRSGPRGDRFLPWKKGFRLKLLRAHPHGVSLGTVRTGVLRERVRTPNGRVQLWNAELGAELERLRRCLDAPQDQGFPFSLIGRRDLRSANSWLHNIPKLMAGKRCRALRMHPSDAAGLGIADGEVVTVRSRIGELQAELRISDEVMRGVVSLPHGWGHRHPTNRKLAVREPGPEYNALIDQRQMEALAGMALLNGYPVAVDRRKETGALGGAW